MMKQSESWKMDKEIMPDLNSICSNGDQKLLTFTCTAKFISATKTRNNAQTTRYDSSYYLSVVVLRVNVIMNQDGFYG